MRLFTCLKQGLKEPKSKKQTADNSSHNTSPLIPRLPHLACIPADRPVGS